jgi:CAAX protease family protein
MLELAFFAITFAASWSLFFAAGALWERGAVGTSAWAAIGTVVYLVGVFAPALVALALTRIAEGREGVRQLLGRIVTWPSSPWWYVFAIVFLAANKLAAAGACRVLTGSWPAFGYAALPIMLAATLVSTPTQAGEELGWRGYALPRLAKRLGLGPASLVIGVIWAAWHLPFFVIASDKTGQSFPVYALAVTATSVALAWVYWQTGGSLLLTMLMHAAVNNTKDIVPSATAAAGSPWTLDATAVAWLTTAFLWMWAVYFLAQMRGAKIVYSALDGALPDHSEPSAISRSK